MILASLTMFPAIQIRRRFRVRDHYRRDSVRSAFYAAANDHGSGPNSSRTTHIHVPDLWARPVRSWSVSGSKAGDPFVSYGWTVSTPDDSWPCRRSCRRQCILPRLAAPASVAAGDPDCTMTVAGGELSRNSLQWSLGAKMTARTPMKPSTTNRQYVAR